jgi:hypothetical protein
MANEDVMQNVVLFNQAVSTFNSSERAHEQLIEEFLRRVRTASVLRLLQHAELHRAEHIEDLVACILHIFNSRSMASVFAEDDAQQVLLAGMLHVYTLHSYPDVCGSAMQLASMKVRSKFMKVLKDNAAVLATNTYVSWVEVASLLSSVVAGEDLSLADSAAAAILKLMTENAVIVQQMAPSVTDSARSYSANSMILMRFADLLARTVAISSETFEVCRSCGAVDLLVDVTRSEDVLLQLNALELLEFIGATSAGISHLFHNGEVSRLLHLAQGSDDAPPDPLLSTTALRVIQQLMKQASKIVTSEGPYLWTSVDQRMVREFLRAALLHVESSDDSSRLAAMYTISQFAAISPESLRLVLEDAVLLRSWLSTLSAKVDLQAACLHSIARVLDPTKSPQPTEDPATTAEARAILHKQLFDQVGAVRRANTTMDYLMRCVLQPLSEVRHGAFDIMRCVAQQPSAWGLRALFGYSGFEEFLENRETEFSKEGKEWKFSVIEAIVTSPASGLLANEVIDALRKILQQGPFYVSGRMAEMETV